MLKKIIPVVMLLCFLPRPALGQIPITDEEALIQAKELIPEFGTSTKLPPNKIYDKLRGLRPLPKEIAPLLAKVLASETGEVQMFAAILLADLTPEDAALVKPLAAAVVLSNPYFSRPAMEALERLGSLAKSASDSVLIAMDSKDGQLRQAGIPVAAMLGKDAIPRLEKLIIKAVESRMKNDQAASAMGKLGPDATATILKLLDMDDPQLEYHAAVALRSMAKKPPEAAKAMVRLAKHKDANLRRPAFDYLVAVEPTAEINDALWIGFDDVDFLIARKCLNALRPRTSDKQKWAEALKKVQDQSRFGGGGALLDEYYALEPKQAKKYISLQVSKMLTAKKSGVEYAVYLSNYLQEISLTGIHRAVIGPMKTTKKVPTTTTTTTPAGQVNAVHLLRFLPVEHTKPVEDKLNEHLNSPNRDLKLAAAEALLRLDTADKGRIAKAMAEALTTPNLRNDFDFSEPLGKLQAIGPAAKSAIPSLRILQATVHPTIRPKILLMIAAFDPDQKAYAVTIAKSMRQDPMTSLLGLAVLVELGEANLDDALKEITDGFDGPSTYPQSMGAIDILGPKAKVFTPRLEKLLANPRNINRTRSAVLLERIDGNRKLLLDRLIQIARSDSRQLSHVIHACGRLGSDARPVLPALIELLKAHPIQTGINADLVRIDPKALRQLGE